MSPNLETLATAAKGGCALSRNELIQHYLPYVRRWASSMVPADDVDDLVQTSMVSVIVALPRWARRGSMASYIRSIVWRQAVMLGRSRRRDMVPLSPEIPSLDLSPDLLIQLARAAKLLSADQRTLLNLAANGATTHELAEALDVGFHTARSRLSRARAALRCNT